MITSHWISWTVPQHIDCGFKWCLVLVSQSNLWYSTNTVINGPVSEGSSLKELNSNSQRWFEQYHNLSPLDGPTTATDRQDQEQNYNAKMQNKTQQKTNQKNLIWMVTVENSCSCYFSSKQGFSLCYFERSDFSKDREKNKFRIVILWPLKV